MANHPSAAKRNRQRVKRTAQNRSVRSALRTQLRAARALIESGDSDAATQAARLAKQALARAASKGVIHRNKAARTTSRLDVALTKLA